MCRKLPCRLCKQFLLSNRKCVSAGGTSQADLSAVTARPADPDQAGLTASAVQLWPQTIRLCSAGKLPFCLFCYLFLHLPEGVLVDDGRVSVSSGIAGILQHPFDFVLVPERRLLGEGDIVRIQLVCQRLIG